MKRQKVKAGLLSLETLEDRTLLAGLFDEGDYLNAFATNNGTAIFSFLPDPNSDSPGDEIAIWEGDDSAELIIYGDRLPEEIGTLMFSNLSIVTIVGEREPGIVWAGDVDVLALDFDPSGSSWSEDGALHTDNVDLIRFASDTPGFMSLIGDEITIEAPQGLTAGFGLMIVSANVLEIVASEQVPLNSNRTQLVQTPDADGGPLVLSLINIEPSSLSLSGDLVDIEDSAIGTNDELSEEARERVLEALDLLAENESLFDTEEYEEIRTALLALVNVEQGDSDDLAGSESLLLTGLEGDRFELPEAYDDTDVADNDPARFAESDLDVRSSQTGVEMKETETGLKVFVLADENADSTGSLAEGAATANLTIEYASQIDFAEESESSPKAQDSLGMLDSLVALLSRTSTAGEALRNHLLNQIANELTPGGQTGLLVDGSRGVVRKDFIQRGS